MKTSEKTDFSSNKEGLWVLVFFCCYQYRELPENGPKKLKEQKC